jgi:hypothetical protein
MPGENTQGKAPEETCGIWWRYCVANKNLGRRREGEWNRNPI